MNLYYSSEIVDAIEKYYKYNPFDVLPILQDIVNCTDDKYIRGKIDDICYEHNLCPHCFTRLYIVPKLEYRGECGEQKAYEEVFLKHCLNCGWDEV